MIGDLAVILSDGKLYKFSSVKDDMIIERIIELYENVPTKYEIVKTINKMTFYRFFFGEDIRTIYYISGKL